jgi:aspartate kinase
MRITVMKFGGTSIADPEKIQRAASRAVSQRRRGSAVIVVVSAPGEMTDQLLDLSRRIAINPSGRELDQLITSGEIVGVSLFAMACMAKGAPAISLTAAQAGIKAFGSHAEANILSIRPARLLSELRRGKIAVVAGFQGLNFKGDVMSLGRGGSDLTAVALAAVVKSDSCEIFTDVKGIYTADPRIVSEAKLLKEISLLEMIELSKSGAQVMQRRSLEIARKNRVTLHVRSAFHPHKGTLIVTASAAKPRRLVSALALKKNDLDPVAIVSVVGPRVGSSGEVKGQIIEALTSRRIKVLAVSTSPMRIAISLKRSEAEAALRLIHKTCRLEHAHPL